MKKVLFGTTALVAAAFVGQAAVAKAVKLKVGGYYNAGVAVGGLIDDDDRGAPAIDFEGPGSSLDVGIISDNFNRVRRSDADKDFHIISEGEIQFKGKGTLDNGIGIEVRVELEAFSESNDQIDEAWVKVKSSLGTVLIGSNDTALDAVAGGIGRMKGGVAGGSWDRDFALVPGASDHHLGDEGDDMAIHYYSPNIAGFEFGVSWAPATSTDGTSDDASGADNDINTAVDPENSEDAISVALAYSNTFGDVDFAIGGGYYTESGPQNGTNNDDGISDADLSDLDVESYGGGVELGFGDFTVGGAVAFREVDTTATTSDELLQWGAGVEYATGPWIFGVSALVQNYEDNTGAQVGEVDTFLINAAVGYKLGKGVNIGLGLDYGEAEFDAPGAVGADGKPVTDEEGFGGLLLLGVKF